MTRYKAFLRSFGKPLLYGVLLLAGGIALLLLSQYVKHKAATKTPVATTATLPADETVPPVPGRLPRRRQADPAASTLSSLLLLFAMACFVSCCICIGWLVVEIRNSRPAWKRQTRFPRMRE